MRRVLTIPENALNVTSAFRMRWFWAWVGYPIAAFFASWIVVLFMPLLYMILLAVAQSMAIEIHSSVKNYKFIIAHALLSSVCFAVFLTESPSFGYFFFMYFMAHSVADLWMRQYFVRWRMGYWSTAHVLLAVLWLPSWDIYTYLTATYRFDETTCSFILIMLGGALSNIITGIALHLATQSRYES